MYETEDFMEVQGCKRLMTVERAACSYPGPPYADTRYPEREYVVVAASPSYTACG